MFLRDIAIYADKKIVERFSNGFVQRFHRETCCVVDMYLSFLRRNAETDGIAKVELTFTDLLSDYPDVTDARALINVLVAPWPFRFAQYQDANAREQKQCILNALLEALLWLGEHRHWDTSCFHAAFEACMNRDLSFEGLSRKSWRSPCGRYRARVFFKYDLHAVELFAVLFKNRATTEVARKYLGAAVPEMGCLSDLLSNGVWKSRTEFVVTATDFRKTKWHADFSGIL